MVNQNNSIRKISGKDLLNFLKYIYQKKIIILSSIMIFAIAGYLYGSSQIKYYVSTVKIKNIPNVYLDRFSEFLKVEIENNLGMENHSFNNDFNLNLQSHDNFIEFINNYKDIESYKADLNRKNISLKKHFKNKLKKVNWDDYIKYPTHYSFKFDEFLPGDQILNDYIIFIKKLTNEQYKNQITLFLKNKIDYFTLNLDIAKKIELDYPILKPGIIDQTSSAIEEPRALFYKGTRVLSYEVDYLKRQIKEVSENFDLEKYDPFQEKASSPELISFANLYYVIFGSIAGLILPIFLFLH